MAAAPRILPSFQLIPLSCGVRVEALKEEADKSTLATLLSQRKYSTVTQAIKSATIAGNPYVSLFILSQEVNLEKARIYHVYPWSTLAAALVKTPGHRRSFYELIPEAQACHFFADIDLPQVTEGWSEDGIHAQVIEQLKTIYRRLKSAIPAIMRAIVLLTTAHKASKYSCHVVMRFFNAAGEALMFEHTACVRLLLQSLIQESSISSSFFDMQVYRRNAEMRMLGATKFDEPTRPFVFSQLFSLEDSAEAGVTRGVVPASDIDILYYSTITQFHMLAALISCSTSLKRKHDVLYAQDFKHDQSRAGPATVYSEVDRGEEMSNNASSPSTLFECIDVVRQHIEELLRVRLITNPLQFHLYTSGTAHQLVFKSSGTFCEIVNRHHRSNHVYYVCSLNARSFYQGCFDDECVSRTRRRRTTNTTVAMYSERGRGVTYFLDYKSFKVIQTLLSHLPLLTPHDGSAAPALTHCDNTPTRKDYPRDDAIPSTSHHNTFPPSTPPFFGAQVTINGVVQHINIPLEDLLGFSLV